jgi:antitoxin YefM
MWYYQNIEADMDAITYTQARKNFAKAMNAVCDDHVPLIITRQNEKPVVMMSLEDYSAIEETLYLLRSPGNAARLSKALHELGQKQFTKRKLVEENLIEG